MVWREKAECNLTIYEANTTGYLEAPMTCRFENDLNCNHAHLWRVMNVIAFQSTNSVSDYFLLTALVCGPHERDVFRRSIERMLLRNHDLCLYCA